MLKLILNNSIVRYRTLNKVTCVEIRGNNLIVTFDDGACEETFSFDSVVNYNFF